MTEDGIPVPTEECLMPGHQAGPLEDCLSIESAVIGDEAVGHARTRACEIIDTIRNHPTFIEQSGVEPIRALQAAYALFRPNHYEIALALDIQTLLAVHLSHRKLDCYSLSMILLQIAHEEGWKASLCPTPGHFVLCCRPGINLDLYDGALRSDSEVEAKWGSVGEPIQWSAVRGVVFLHRSEARKDALLEDLNQSLAAWPECAAALGARGAFLLQIKYDYDGAIADYRNAHKLQSGSRLAAANLAEALIVRAGEKRHELSIREIQDAIDEAEMLCARAEASNVAVAEQDALTQEIRRHRTKIADLRTWLVGGSSRRQ